MRLIELVQRLQLCMPTARDREVACMAMMLCDRLAELGHEVADRNLQTEIDKTLWRLQAANDQHAAVAAELDALASTEPCEFDPTQLWTLIRAIKVQGQLIDLYSDSVVVAS